jgi:hypothetical protein
LELTQDFSHAAEFIGGRKNLDRFPSFLSKSILVQSRFPVRYKPY